MLLGKARSRRGPEGGLQHVQHFVFPQTSPALQNNHFHAASHPTWQIFSGSRNVGASCVPGVSSPRFRCVQSRRKATFMQTGSAEVIIFVQRLVFQRNVTVPALLLEGLRNLARSCRFPFGFNGPFQEKVARKSFLTNYGKISHREHWETSGPRCPPHHHV